jgi:hypothetical protein
VDDYSTISHPLGLAAGDLALLAGGVALVIAVLFLGLAGNRRGRRRWLSTIGWLTLVLSVGALGFGTVRSTASAETTQPA